ncbi:hypothetical protein MTR_2g089430 [Medicago truncatula]|uniref:Uncharacterized protein n=1 Tax=Medicago truncatula TaxID=3880 RepID=G7IRM1_MEDTR|nr:hypothetical protein MTR_2g089430 [Medicago truncatula]
MRKLERKSGGIRKDLNEILSLYSFWYGLVIVNDYNICSYIKYLRNKDGLYSIFVIFCKQVQVEKDLKIAIVRSDHGGEKNVPTHFRTEAANACYIQNIIYLRPILKNTTYELWKGRKSNISYFHQFGCNEFLFSNHKCMCF